VRHFDEPFADSTAVPTWYVSELARRHVTVVLTGEGGDEALAGYETYRAQRFAALYSRLPRFVGAGLVPGVVRSLPVSHARDSFDYKAKKFVAAAYLQPAARHLWWMRMLQDDVKAALYASDNGARANAHAALAPTGRLYDALYRESDGDDLDRLQYIDTMLYLPGDLLAKTDRMSMAHSLEARVPFLDRAVVELARRIPSSLRLHRVGTRYVTKYMLRRAMAGRLPEPILRQRKLGFNLPIASWLAGELRDFARDVLAPRRISRLGLFDPRAVERLLTEHVERREDHSRALWALLFLVVWHDEVLASGRSTRAEQAAPGPLPTDRPT
jgi:asparagine synthase (glutamine-hydrolysing)